MTNKERAEIIDKAIREGRCRTHGGPDCHLGTGTLECASCRRNIIEAALDAQDKERERPAGNVNYRVWDCKIVVPVGASMPEGFDYPPRRAAIEAVEAEGVEVISCFSGWGGSLTESELICVEKK